MFFHCLQLQDVPNSFSAWLFTVVKHIILGLDVPEFDFVTHFDVSFICRDEQNNKSQ